MPGFLLEPALNSVRAVLALPSFQHRVVTTLGLNDLAAMRVFVGFHFPRLASTGGACCRAHLAHASLRILDVDDITQTETISRKQIRACGIQPGATYNLFLS